MNRRTPWVVSWTGTLLGSIGAIGCFEDPTPLLTHGEESGDGDGDSGDGDGDSGDGDGDTGDGDGDGDSGDGDGDSGDGDGDTGDGDGDGDCGVGEMLCNGSCTDVQTDPLNCGNCGTQCGAFNLCGEGICKAEKYVFATNTLYVGNFGQAQADIKCLEAAAAAQLPNGVYKAWISTANTSPSSWPASEGVYHLRQGAVVAYSHADLMDGDLAHPIDRDEYGQLLISAPACSGAVSNGVWTGTTPQGMFGGSDCFGWTSNVDIVEGQVGDASKSDGNWSLVAGCMAACNTPLHIYCFQL